ncbi:hypothetical protein [Geomesophilobacter sediminis]|uniref:Cytochrome C n=1 Tax=Geomesophilobacter sediminis TaxID=2798584 RepID=A0A8J7M2V1_9BACT|nr:hypothetical protein [Geomesophilobacter sediminis]MBJ6727278.1 hypothetical protein [Geomesophilobacter sediminis]
MFKKSLASALLVCTVPALASGAWFLTTKVNNQGGTLSYNIGGVSAFQTYTSGAKTKSFSAAGPQSVAFTPVDANHTLQSVKIVSSYVNAFGNMTTETSTSTNGTAGFTPVDGANYSISAYFNVNRISVKAANAYGTATPSSVGNVYYGYVLQKDLVFTFSPNANYSITGLTDTTGTLKLDGTDTNVVVSNTKAVNQKATVTLKAGYTFNGPINLVAAGSSIAPALSAPAPQNVAAGSAVSLTPTAANLGTPTFNWYYVSGPKNTVSYDNSTGKMVATMTPAPAVTGFTSTQIINTGMSASGNVNNVYVADAVAANGKVSMTIPATAPAGQYKFLVQTVYGGKTYSSIATVNVLASTTDSGTLCQNCHSANNIPSASAFDQAINTRYKASIHGQSTTSSCAGCHFNGVNGNTAAGHPGTVNGDTVDNALFTANVDGVIGGFAAPVAKGAVFCSSCHGALPHGTSLANGVTCVQCHTSGNGQGGTGDAHAIQGLSCQGCHAIAQTNKFTDRTLASDDGVNQGVRAVTGEFSKWSHHIVNANGAAPLDEQCAICHLEGSTHNYGHGDSFVVDGTKHMADKFIHLRNAQTDADMQWDPSNPNHTTMDNFCMSCHSAAGATSATVAKLQGIISQTTGIAANPLNPFLDTISNRYDKMLRPRVTNVDNQFDTTNNSHHGVKGARYTGRTRNAGPRQIASAGTFANNSSTKLQGIRSTIYDAGNFNNLYVPLGQTATQTPADLLGDDSTLHCGDCHTVGQFKTGSATNADGSATTAVIGAHGSNNEYMLRNSIGTDQRHVAVAYTSSSNVVTVTNAGAAYLVCFNCHSYNKYGSIFVGTGADAGNAAASELANIQPHAGEYANADRCNGSANTLSFNGYTTGAGTDGFTSRFAVAPTAADLAAGYQSMMPDKGTGNVFGIQCLNCHNSGAANSYGGIHGSANNTNWTDATGTLHTTDASVTGGAYIDGMGNTQKVERFLPGLGNAMYVPGNLGGATNGVASDTNWEQKHWQQTATTVINYKTAVVTGTASSGAGCYTLGTTTTATNVAAGLVGPSQTGPTGPATALMDNWGGCEDHSAAQGAGNHGFLKRIVRPVTY